MSTSPGAAASAVTLVKLGGSVITVKSGREELRAAVVKRLSSELATAATPIIVGHGSGSFGHLAASETGAKDGRFNADQEEAAVQTQLAARRLHSLILDSLVAAGMAPASMPPAAWCHWGDDELQANSWVSLHAALAAGATPVTMGDVVWVSDGSARIASTEEVFLLIAAQIPVERAIWVGDTDGILDSEGRTVARLTGDEEDVSVGDSAAVDVTGGMKLRWQTVRQLAARGISSWLINGQREGELASALSYGEVAGTVVSVDRWFARSGVSVDRADSAAD